MAYSTLDVRALVTNTIVDTGGAVGGQPVLEPTLDLQTAINDADDDLIFSLGMLYRVPDKWSVGAIYKKGPRFAVEEVITSSTDLNGDGEPDGLDVFGVGARLGTRFNNRFSLPDTVAVGGSWLPSGRLTLTAEIQRVLYSNLLDEYISGVNVMTSPDAEFTIDDATDYRVGLEYVLLNRNSWLPPLALRGGAFSEEASTIRAVSTGSSRLASEDVFRGSGRQEHLTLGLGFIFKRYKLDLAADFSELDNEFLLSFIYQGK